MTVLLLTALALMWRHYGGPLAAINAHHPRAVELMFAMALAGVGALAATLFNLCYFAFRGSAALLIRDGVLSLPMRPWCDTRLSDIAEVRITGAGYFPSLNIVTRDCPAFWLR